MNHYDSMNITSRSRVLEAVGYWQLLPSNQELKYAADFGCLNVNGHQSRRKEVLIMHDKRRRTLFILLAGSIATLCVGLIFLFTLK